MRLALLICVILGFCGSWAVASESGRLTSTQFYRLTHLLMTRHDQHEKLIKTCTDATLAPADKAQLEAIAKIHNLPPDGIVQRLCRYFVKGTAAGTITYTDYMRWMDEADRTGVVVFPDLEKMQGND
ncbi:MAG: hypothetical protein JWL86_2893 [Rhizobium sp.]|nr:hypothetical protein [Rhizobium sp.]